MEEVAAEENEIDSSLSADAKNLFERLQRVFRPNGVFATEAQVDVGSEEDLEDVVLRTSLQLGHCDSVSVREKC